MFMLQQTRQGDLLALMSRFIKFNESKTLTLKLILTRVQSRVMREFPMTFNSWSTKNGVSCQEND